MSLTLIQGGAAATMSSLELLALVNEARTGFGETEVRRNDFTARCIDELSGEHYETFVVDNQNGTRSEAVRMSEDQCMYVLMRESKAVRRAVVEKIKMLMGHSPAIPQTYAQALRLAAEQAERIEAQARELEAARPAVEFVDRFVEAKSCKGFREVAKILGVREREFIADLAARKIIFKQGSNWLPFAEHQHSGHFEVKTGEANGHAFHQTRFTPDGIAWIAKRYSTQQAA